MTFLLILALLSGRPTPVAPTICTYHHFGTHVVISCHALKGVPLPPPRGTLGNALPW